MNNGNGGRNNTELFLAPLRTSWHPVPASVVVGGVMKGGEENFEVFFWGAGKKNSEGLPPLCKGFDPLAS